MKNFLLGFLMFVMLMPGLACGPIMSAGKAHASQTSMQGMKDCQGMGMSGAKKAPGSDSPTFFKDCSKVDLQNADGHASLKQPDISGKTFFVALATVPDYGFTPTGFHAIRAPPPDWPDLSQTQPSILLTTQRFRE